MEWELLKCTGGYYSVEKKNEKGHLVKRFMFWGDEGRYEAKELVDYLNKQDKLVLRLKTQLNEQYGPIAKDSV